MQIFGQEKDQCLCNSLLNFCVDCERGVVGQKWIDAEKKKRKKDRQPETECFCHSSFTNLNGYTQACTHKYAVTKASQIGNSFSQFRFNDHRGNVNVSDVAGASLYSLPASIFVLHDGTRSEGDRRLDDMLSNRMKSDERQKHCRVPPKKKKKKRVINKKRMEMQPPLVPGPSAPHSRGPARHTMPAGSHLHLNGLLCTEDFEMSFCGRLTSLPWQNPLAVTAAERNNSVVAAGLLTRKPQDPLRPCLSFHQVLCTRQCEKQDDPTFGGRCHH